jgi:hypothetical protein
MLRQKLFRRWGGELALFDQAGELHCHGVGLLARFEGFQARNQAVEARADSRIADPMLPGELLERAGAARKVQKQVLIGPRQGAKHPFRGSRGLRARGIGHRPSLRDELK